MTHGITEAYVAPPRKKRMECTLESLTYLVCQAMCVPVERIMERTRKREIVYARFAIIFFAGLTTTHTQMEIVKYFRLSCHSGYEYAVGQISAFCYTDKKFRYLINSIADYIDPRLKQDFEWNK